MNGFGKYLAVVASIGVVVAWNGCDAPAPGAGRRGERSHSASKDGRREVAASGDDIWAGAGDAPEVEKPKSAKAAAALTRVPVAEQPKSVTPAAAPAPAPRGPKVGTIVFTEDFEDAARRAAWSKAAFARFVPEGENGSTCVVVRTPDGAEPGHHKIAVPFGMKLHFECRARADGVTKPPNSWNGVKYMLHFKSPTSGPHWRNQGDVHGTFGWRTLAFDSRIAADATGGELVLGLEACVGTVWLDALKVVVSGRRPAPRPAPDPNAPPAYRGHDLPRLRGVMSPQQLSDEDLRVLGLEWKANLIRWQMTRYWGQANTDRDLADYDRWMADELNDLDKALDACARYGIMLVIDVHSPPGGRLADKSMRMFHEAKYADHFVELWRKIARRFKGRPGLWAYDLVNEPVQGGPPPEGVDDYLGLQVRAARAIREIDPTTAIIIESDEWDSPTAFAALDLVDVPNIVYQAHMYYPGQFTHQGVHGRQRDIRYPGTIGGKHVDKNSLRACLEPVREFQLAYNVHIYIGEFSAARWAPGAADYLRDCIEIFEEYGWDWSYHAYREWSGWSLEHGPDPDDQKPTTTPTDRKRVVLGWFAKNRKPAPRPRR